MFSTNFEVTWEELDTSNSCKRRQSEPPLPRNSSQHPRDESYVKALSKFNEWRHRQIFGSTTRLNRKQSKKLREAKNPSESLQKNVNLTSEITTEIIPKHMTKIGNDLYEEIEVNCLNDISPFQARNAREIVPVRHSFPITDPVDVQTSRSSFTGQQIYENAFVDLVSQFDRSPDIVNISKHILTPPVKFFKENSNPFTNVRTPIREQSVEKDSEDLFYESPRNPETLDALRETFKRFDVEDRECDSTSSNGTRRLYRNPPYQTIINKHGDEVEYALPLNEKLDEEKQAYFVEDSNERDCRIISLNNTTSYQQYIDDNFQFLNEKHQLGVSDMSVCLGKSQFYRGNVPVTDLDKTNGTKVTDDQNNSKDRDVIQELESLQIWSQTISENIENHIIRNTTNMHFAEVIVCNTSEVTENVPRHVFKTLNGTLSSGAFHCVPITQFKPHVHEQFYGGSALQLNYEILRKIRHPDVVILMGITVDNKCALDSLILEPLNFSLNHLIHVQNGCIPIQICLLYTLQINNAATYLHKHGLIHSNISTHSVVMCHSSKAVKLTSFELATKLNEDLRDDLLSVFQNENQHIDNIINLPYKLRPYYVNYRKTFSKHNYQAPELLSNQFPFVFPKIQCDVYGICLMLWEMLNCSTPFANLSYDETMKLIYLQNAKLPIIQKEKQKPFERVLESGLNMMLEKRISDTIELKQALNQILLDPDNKSDLSNYGEKFLPIKDFSDGIPSFFNSKAFSPMIYERTSTIKKRKNIIGENRMSARQLFEHSQVDKTKEASDVIIPSHTSSPNSPVYGFNIGEVFLPETPIARSNKLRKTAWLSNQSISPIVHLEINSKDTNAAINQIQIVENKTHAADEPNKLFNVNIRIRPNSIQNKLPQKNDDELQSSAENNTFEQPTKNLSQISDHIKFFNLVSQSNPLIQPIHSQAKLHSPKENSFNYNKNIDKPIPTAIKILNQYPESMVNQKNINEFFSRSQHSADFENSLWRREKQMCDQSIKSPRRISVKDAVNKFESFSKSMLSESNSPKSRHPLSNLEEKQKVISTTDMPPNRINSDESISKLNIVLRKKYFDGSKEGNAEPKIIEDKSECYTKPNILNKSPMLTLNFKKLDRRASDIGSYFIHQNLKTKPLTTRHSIYGTEIFKRLRKTRISRENQNEQTTEVGDATKLNRSSDAPQDGKKDYKIKVGKLTCLNCGHKLFVVDDVVSSTNGSDTSETCTEFLLTPLTRSLGNQQIIKSTEDFYIDDDFCEDIELCANMELGTQSHLSDLIDFDILSAEIFNTTEKNTNRIA